jgi:hypothetical protein
MQRVIHIEQTLKEMDATGIHSESSDKFKDTLERIVLATQDGIVDGLENLAIALDAISYLGEQKPKQPKQPKQNDGKD